MWCMKCRKHISECICPDIEERLAELTAPGTHVVSQFCKKCGKHRDRCKCEKPELQITGLIKPGSRAREEKEKR